MKTVISVDIGTSSLKAAIISSDGTLLAYSRRDLILHNTEHAAKEWLPALHDAVQELFTQQPQQKISAICISGNGPTLVATDGTTLLWNAPISQPKEPLQTSSLFIPRLLEFKRKFATVWQASKHILSGPEYLIFQLTGKAFTILPQKRYQKAYWDNKALTDCSIIEASSKLAPFTYPSCLAGYLTEQQALYFKRKQNGLTSTLPVYCGAPDFVSAIVGTNTLNPGSLCDRAGSSEGLNLCVSKPIYAEGIRTLPSISANLWNISFLIPKSGTRFNAYKQKVERLQGFNLKGFNQKDSKVNLNTLVNECINAKENNELYTQGKNIIMQTALEVKEGINILLKAATQIQTPIPDSITVTGGQASNDNWNQLKATVTGLKVVVPSCSDAELLGDAVFAFTGMGIFSSIEQGASSLFKPAKIFYPE